MACCKGDPTEMIKLGGSSGPRYSKEQQELQRALIEMVSGQMGKNTAYQGATTAAVDPLQLMAANIMSTMGSGKGYTAPSFLSPQGMMGGGSNAVNLDYQGGNDGGSKNKRQKYIRTLPMRDSGESQEIREQRGYGVGPGWNTDMSVPNRQSTWPTGYDPLNDPNGWNRWWY